MGARSLFFCRNPPGSLVQRKKNVLEYGNNHIDYILKLTTYRNNLTTYIQRKKENHQRFKKGIEIFLDYRLPWLSPFLIVSLFLIFPDLCKMLFAFVMILQLLYGVTSQLAIPKSYLGTETQVLCNMTMALPMLKKVKFPWNCTQAQQKIGSWCSWTGVTCAPNGGTGNTIITSIGLSKQKIAGSIPSAIGLLTTLQFLFLDQNALMGTIPSSLGQLINLQTLHLESNYLSGTLPLSLASLTNLVVLNVNNNYLTGTLATSFQTMGYTNDDYFGTAMTYNEMKKPTGQPTNKPTFGYRPSHPPTPKPSTPTGQPTQRPSGPTKTPTLSPTKTPTKSPTCM